MALAALVLVAFSQASLAGHQFEHDAGSAAEVCGICMGLQSHALPPSTGSAFVAELFPDACPASQAASATPSDGVAAYPARGPPRIR